MQKDCPRGNQQASEAGKAAAKQSGKSSKGGAAVSQGEEQRGKNKEEKVPTRSLDRKSTVLDMHNSGFSAEDIQH